MRTGTVLRLSRMMLSAIPILVVLALSGGVDPLSVSQPSGSGKGGDGRSQASEEWLSQATTRIALEEYELSWKPCPLATASMAWQAPNRAHGLRAYFTSEGISIEPRVALEDSWSLSIEMTGYGRGELVLPVEPPVIEAQGRHVELDRVDVIEWYDNDPQGLKQGFTLSQPPEKIRAWEGISREAAGASDVTGGPLVVAMQLSGALHPSFAADGKAVDFHDADGFQALRYGDLEVKDADGSVLDAAIEPCRGRGIGAICLVIDDSEAVYPITVDPVLTGAGSVSITSPGALFGHSVATAGDVNADGYSDVIVGAYGYDGGVPEQGRVFVYYGTPSGLPTTADWTIQTSGGADRLGYSVSTAGDVNQDGISDIVVGAPYADVGTYVDAGRALVFHGSPTGLDAEGARPVGMLSNADWTYGGNGSSQHLGEAVAPAGDVNGDWAADILVGAPNATAPGTPPKYGAGRVYAFYGSGTGLPGASAYSWARNGASSGDNFGASVATAGDVDGDGYADVVIGSPQADLGAFNEGAALIYMGSAGGLLSSPARVLELNAEGAFFGSSVSTAGDLNADGFADLLVGAPDYTSAYASQGRVNVYLGTPDGIPSSPTYALLGSSAGAQLGHSVCTAGDIDGDGHADFALGAPGGRYFEVWRGAPGGLTPGPAFTATSTASGFATSVAPAGDINGDGLSDLVVGSPSESKALLYLGHPQGPADMAAWTVTFGTDAGGALDGEVFAAGDVNGDGHGDVIMVVPEMDVDEGAGPVQNAGLVTVYYGGPGGIDDSSPTWQAHGSSTGQGLGSHASRAGDVNGDGYDDILITDATSQTFLFLGSATGLDQDGTRPVGTAANADWVTAAEQATAAGDVNGDGFGDLITRPSLNTIRVYHGSSAGPPSESWSTSRPGGEFGYAFSTAGDMNADGYSDIAVSDPQYDVPETEGIEGAVFVFFGSASGIQETPWTNVGGGGHYGTGVESAGDYNGDGFSDLVVRAPFGGQTATVQAAKIWLICGNGASCGSVVPVPSWTGVPSDAGGAGDVNGDGFSDIITSQWHDEGQLFVYFGNAGGVLDSPGWTLLGPSSPPQLLGKCVEGVGDVDGDGRADLMACNWKTAQLHLGGGGHGRLVRSRQLRPSSGGPIAALGATDSPDMALLSALGWSSAGRAPVRLEWEQSPLGSPLNGFAGGATSWTDSGIEGVEQMAGADGLGIGQAYHWQLRMAYHPGVSPFAPHGPWIHASWSGLQEADFRTLLCDDHDGDGFGTATTSQCPGGTAVDCDDLDAAVYPGAPELCDRKKNDCDAPAIPPGDIDGDGDSYAACDGDCDDLDATVYPDAPELCDGQLNDCNGSGLPSDEVDADGDGFPLCGECDDADPLTYPGAPEICDGHSNDCGDPAWPDPPVSESGREKLLGLSEFTSVGNSYRVTPDGAYAVVYAYSAATGERELYSVRVADGARRQISSAPSPPNGVTVGPALITPDSASAVYTATAGAGTSPQIYRGSISVDEAPIQLSDPAHEVDLFQVTPEGGHVVYSILDPADFTFGGLYSVPIGGGSPAWLGGSVSEDDIIWALEFTPDGHTAVYYVYNFIGDHMLASVPVAGGPPVELSDTSMEVSGNFEITPDGQAVIHLGASGNPVMRALYSIPISGGARTLLTTSLAPGRGVTKFAVTGDGERIVYLADQDVDGVMELYALPVGGGASVKLNGSLVAGGNVSWFEITSDSQAVVYEADQEIDGVDELYRVAITGGTVTKVTSTPAPNQRINRFELTDNNAHAVFRAIRDTAGIWDLYSVPLAGGPVVRLNDPVVSPAGAVEFFLSPDSRSVVYRPNESPIRNHYAVPVAGGVSMRLGQVPVAGGGVVTGSSTPSPITPDSSRIVYVADEEVDQVWELFTARLMVDSDGDLILDQCDVCPDLADIGQADADGDGAGAACDCNDDDDTVYPGAPELCDGRINDCNGTVLPPDEVDADGDGAPLCIDCDDLDGWVSPGASELPCDGRVNNCASPGWPYGTDSLTRKLVAMPGPGHGVDPSIRTTSDSRYAVYVADAVVDHEYELYAVQIWNGTIRQISTAPSPPGGVTTDAPLITPDGHRALYRARCSTCAGWELYAGITYADAPPVRLSAAGQSVPSSYVFLTPDGSTAVYGTHAGGTFQGLYSVSIYGGTPQLIGPPIAGTEVWMEPVRFTPDSSRAVYVLSDPNDASYAFASVSVSAGGPVSLLDPAIAPIYEFVITPDGQAVLYRGLNSLSGSLEIFAVPILGGASVRLQPPMGTGSDVLEFGLSPDGTRVVYRADQDTDGTTELYSIPVSGGSSVKLNGSMAVGGNVRRFFFTPDSQSVVYEADQDVDGVTELYVVPANGGASTKLSGPPLPLQSLGNSTVMSDGSRVLFQAGDGTGSAPVNLYAVPLAGGVPVQLNDSLASPSGVVDFHLDAGGTVAVYLARREPLTWVYYAVPVTGGRSVRLGGIPVPGGSVSLDTESGSPVLANGSEIVYVADEETENVRELFAAKLRIDSDGDQILDLCDNCDLVPSLDQTDLDDDGYGAPCDCDDEHRDAHPGSAEVCDFLDNDCNGQVDEGFDGDGDGFGDCLDSCPGQSNPAQSGNAVYIVQYTSGELSRIDLQDGSRTAVAGGMAGATAVALDGDGAMAYVTGGGAVQLYQVDLAMGTVTPLVTDAGPWYDIELSPSTSTAYVADNGRLLAVDLTSGAYQPVTGAIATGSYSAALNAAGTRAYLADNADPVQPRLLVVDLSTGAITPKPVTFSGMQPDVIYSILVNQAETHAYLGTTYIGIPQIWSMDLASGMAQALTNVENFSDVPWDMVFSSAAESHVVIAEMGWGVSMVDLGTGTISQLAERIDSIFGVARLRDACGEPGCTDGDGDGFGLPGSVGCPGGSLWDCDDAEAGVYPGAPEVCDGVTSDCGTPFWPQIDPSEHDADGDAWPPCAGDCAEGDGSIYPGAPEINDGQDNQCAGDPGAGTVDEVTGGFGEWPAGDTVCWPPQAGATSYQVVRSTDPRFGGGCESWLVTGNCLEDPAVPPSGEMFFYRVRAAGPHIGSWGENPGLGEVQIFCVAETVCDDGIDDDVDGLADCSDPDCAGIAGCGIGADISSDTHVTQGLAVDDVNGDGWLDVIAANSGGVGSNEINRFYLGNGTSEPWAGVVGQDIGTDVGSSFSPRLVDVTGDGFPDLLMAGATSQTNRQYLHDGSADPWSAVVGTDITADVASTFVIAVEDVNGDGFPDVVAGNYGANRYYLHNGTGDPWNGVAGKNLDTDLLQTWGLALGDVNGDGHPDAVVGNRLSTNRLYLNNGTSDPWAGVSGIEIGPETDDTRSVLLADLNGDGHPDLIVANSAEPNRIYFNNGTENPWSGVAASDLSGVADPTYAVAVGDVDGDGHPDLVVGNFGTPNLLYVNNGSSDPFAGVLGIPITTDAHQTTDVVLADVDGDGVLDLLVANAAQVNRYYRSLAAYITP